PAWAAGLHAPLLRAVRGGAEGACLESWKELDPCGCGACAVGVGWRQGGRALKAGRLSRPDATRCRVTPPASLWRQAGNALPLTCHRTCPPGTCPSALPCRAHDHPWLPPGLLV